MGKSTPSAPTPPDPVRTANAQSAADLKTSIAQSRMNNVNQYTPYGNLVYEEYDHAGDGVPRYQAIQTLSPDAQRQLDLTNQAGIQFGETANRQLSNVSDALSRPVDFSTLGPAPEANEATRQSVRDSQMARLQPQLDQDRAALETRLANQGIGIGTQAYNQEFDRFQRGVNDLRLATDSTAGDEMARLYGIESDARSRSANEMVQERQIPLNETIGLLSGTQVQNPQFVNTPQTNLPRTPLAESIYASYNGQLNAANQRAAASSANNQGLFGLIGAGAGAYASNPGAFSFSDIRLKTNIARIGQLVCGLPVYAFDYIWGGPRQVGVMAQEALGVAPWAVAVHPSGYLMVDYSSLGGAYA